MLRTIIATAALLAASGAAMSQDHIEIASPWGSVTATIADNPAGAALLEMLPLRIEMRDHLRQEKTGDLPSALPRAPRQQEFSAGTLGLWNSGDFVIYYREGRVPRPGIVILGEIEGDVSIFDRPGEVTVEISRATDLLRSSPRPPNARVTPAVAPARFRPVHKDRTDIENKVIIITGASSGIG